MKYNIPAIIRVLQMNTFVGVNIAEYSGEALSPYKYLEAKSLGNDLFEVSLHKSNAAYSVGRHKRTVTVTELPAVITEFDTTGYI